MTKYSREFLAQIPKSDLHVHIDGSLRLGTLIELAKEAGVELPSYTEEGLLKLVFKKKYEDLVDYLRGFHFTFNVMRTKDSIARVCYEMAMDCFADGVRYIEPRFAPHLHSRENLTVDEVIVAANDGLARAKREINERPEIKGGKEPRFEYGIICCALRMFTKEFPGYYRKLMQMHPHMPQDDLASFASFDLVRTMVHVRDDLGVPLVGVDLAGAEEGYPAEDHKAAYELAHRHFFKKTVHAGEAYGPASIFQAITDCHADRIGHGTHIFDAEMVDLPSKEAREAYVEDLWQFVADSRMTIEVCLTSNLQTMPKFKSVKQHPIAKMLEKQMSVSICTDNTLISRTSITDELELLVNNFSIKPKKLRDIIIYGFKRSFFSGDYLVKRAYVREIIDYYEAVQEKFGIVK